MAIFELMSGVGESDRKEPDLDGTVATVTDLNNDLSGVISSADVDFDFIIGDISNKFLSNGTLHFDLVDNNAKIHCLLFNANRKDTVAFDESERIAVKGRLNFYEGEASVSVFVSDGIPIGDSHYHLKIKQLREALKKEGLFDDENKQNLPESPGRVGVVTAASSDAEQDAINGIHVQHPGINIFLADSRVQGDNAVEDLCKTIAYFDEFAPVDVIVVTRGGGSEQALHAFNSEGVSRMIASTSTPIVTAIGHENDRPIVDDIADARAMTPTEIGLTVAPEKDQLVERNAELRDRVENAYRQAVDSTALDYRGQLESAYVALVRERLTAMRNNVDSTYSEHASTRVTDIRNDVDTAFKSLKQEKRHKAETEELQAREQLYKLAVIVLSVILFGVLVYAMFL
jgi:exodeoxyribonuclease VII large subunit